MTESVVRRWIVPAPETVRWREWDDEYVVYSNARCTTHLLSPASGSIFLALLRSPHSLTGRALLSIALGDENSESADSLDPEAVSAVISTLIEFEQLGLVIQTHS